MNSVQRRRKAMPTLAPFLENLSRRYHRPEFLGSDPLVLVREFTDPQDQEIAALFAALLAYGNVKQIQKSLRTLFGAMGGHPGHFVRHFQTAEARARLAGFKHRFTDEEDVLCLCWLLHQAIRQKGSLEDAFLAGWDNAASDFTQAATAFVDLLHGMPFEPHFDRDRMLTKSSFKHLFPRADRGSACKRIHLFLRWAVRPDDGIDLGLWNRLPTSKLLIPVDTHILRISTHLGLLKSASATLAGAREITASLRAIDPFDPARFDFALCRLGILRVCPTVSELSNCRNCELHDVCGRRKALDKTASRRSVALEIKETT